MLSKSPFNYVQKQLNYILNNYLLNKNTLIILILIIISMSIFYLCIKENFNVPKKIYLDTYFFKTEQEKKNGLMHIKEPLGNKGALFKYKNPQKICIWMKNTFIPLDALFLDNKFQVIEMIKGLIPHDLTNRCSQLKNCSYFIEVDAGFIEKNKVNIGDTIICNHIKFPTKQN